MLGLQINAMLCLSTLFLMLLLSKGYCLRPELEQGRPALGEGKAYTSVATSLT